MLHSVPHKHQVGSERADQPSLMPFEILNFGSNNRENSFRIFKGDPKFNIVPLSDKFQARQECDIGIQLCHATRARLITDPQRARRSPGRPPRAPGQGFSTGGAPEPLPGYSQFSSQSSGAQNNHQISKTCSSVHCGAPQNIVVVEI